MNQVRAELERLISRRFIQIMAVTPAVLGSLVVWITAATSSRPSQAQILMNDLYAVFIFTKEADSLLMILMICVLMVAFLVGASSSARNSPAAR